MSFVLRHDPFGRCRQVHLLGVRVVSQASGNAHGTFRRVRWNAIPTSIRSKDSIARLTPRPRYQKGSSIQIVVTSGPFAAQCESASYSVFSEALAPFFQSEAPERKYGMGFKCVEHLLKENQAARLRDRRSADRKPFARPVQIITGQSETHDAFTRDISPRGIGVISQIEWPQSTIATMTIHSVKGNAITVRAEARWCSPYGDGWYLSGWSFLS